MSDIERRAQGNQAPAEMPAGVRGLAEMPSFDEHMKMKEARERAETGAGARGEVGTEASDDTELEGPTEAEVDEWLKEQAADLRSTRKAYETGNAPAFIRKVQEKTIVRLEQDVIDVCADGPNCLGRLNATLGMPIAECIKKLRSRHPERALQPGILAEAQELMMGEHPDYDRAQAAKAAVRAMESAMGGPDEKDKFDRAQPATLEEYEQLMAAVKEFNPELAVSAKTLGTYLEGISESAPGDPVGTVMTKAEVLLTQGMSLANLLSYCAGKQGGVEAIKAHWGELPAEETQGLSLEQFLQSSAERAVQTDLGTIEVMKNYQLYAECPGLLQRCADWATQAGQIDIVRAFAPELRSQKVVLDEGMLRSLEVERQRARIPELKGERFGIDKLPPSIKQESTREMEDAKQRLEAFGVPKFAREFRQENWEGLSQEEQREKIQGLAKVLRQAYDINAPCRVVVSELPEDEQGYMVTHWYKPEQLGMEGQGARLVPRQEVYLNAANLRNGAMTANTVAHELWHVRQKQEADKSAERHPAGCLKTLCRLPEYYRANYQASASGGGGLGSYIAYRQQLIEYEAWKMGDYVEGMV